MREVAERTKNHPGFYLDEVKPGSTYRSPSMRVEESDIVAFASQFDPQVFHLDAAAARDTFFGTLVASGWHTAAITMRLLVDSEFRPAGGIVGAGFDEFRWPQALRPGDTVTLDMTVLDIIPSRSVSTRGIVKLQIRTLNQDDRPVQILVANLVMQRRACD